MVVPTIVTVGSGIMVQLIVGSIEDPYNNVSLSRSVESVRDGKRDSLGCMVLVVNRVGVTKDTTTVLN